MRKFTRAVCLLAFVLSPLVALEGQTITQYTVANSGTSGFYYGQTAQTPASGGPWNNITFNFYSCSDPSCTSVGAPHAEGNLYILSQGCDTTSPNGLATSPFLIAKSTGISGGVYTFSPTVVLQPSTTYYFCSDANFSGTIAYENGGGGPANYIDFSGPNDPFVGGDSTTLDFNLSGTMVGSSAGVEDAFQVSYISQLNNADTVINITNAGTSAGTNVIQGSTTAGNLCLNIYVFDPQEEEVACCSCVVTPNELIYFNAGGPTEGTPNQSVPVSAGGNGNAGLLYNVITGGGSYSFNSAVVKIVTTTGSTCVNTINRSGPSSITAASFPASALAPGLVAYSTHPHPTNGRTLGSGRLPVNITETPFAVKSLSTGELNFLQYGCAFIQNQATGRGICSCPAESVAGGFAVPR
jgi:hypothetical protein